MTTPVRWGILSTADINRLAVPAMRDAQRVELLGVASRRLLRAEQFARRWAIPRAYGSYKELLDDGEIEAVYISVPNALHCQWSVAALEAGKHVLCEKPLSRRPDEVVRAYEVAARNERLLMEGFMYRHHPLIERLRGLVRDAVVGELRLIRSSHSYGLYDLRNIRLSRRLEGGALTDVGCYCVHAARMIGGEPEYVHADAWFGPSGTDWVLTANMRFPSNVLASFDCGTALTYREELEVVGSEGVLWLRSPWTLRSPSIEVRTAGGVEVVEAEQADCYRLEFEDLSAAIRGDGQPLLGRTDAVAQSRVLAAIEQSARTRRSVRVR
jgi:D-xylose 1-dehydrogenase (NADP+, D-xylono-1,5-lactone-forming)